MKAKEDSEILLNKVDEYPRLVNLLNNSGIKIEVSNNVIVYLNGNKILESKVPFKQGKRIALVSKSACRYSNIKVIMNEESYKKHLDLEQKESERLSNIRKEYPELESFVR